MNVEKQKILKLLATIAKVERKLQLLLNINEKLDDYTDLLWTNHLNESFSWSYHAKTKDEFIEDNDEHYSGDVWGSVTKTEHFTIVHLDSGCGNGHPLCIFDNDNLVEFSDENEDN